MSDYSKPVKLICVLVLLVLSAYFGVVVAQNVSLLG
jgi:Tfp pilus assembly protein PilX